MDEPGHDEEPNMRICAVVKYPPIQGGVSALSYRLVMA